MFPQNIILSYIEDAPTKMTDFQFIRNEDLEKDINLFFQHNVNHYLESLLQGIYKRESVTQEREGSFIIDQFIKKVKEADLSQAHLDSSLDPISNWKKEFTKKVLLPKYLSNGFFIDIHNVIVFIKNAILNAALDKKVSFFKSMCQNKLFKELQQIPPNKRLLKAKLIVSNTVKTLEKSGDDLSKNLFLQSFHTESLKEFLSKVPYKPIQIYNPLELENNIRNYIKEQLQKSICNLTSKLKIVNMLLMDFKKNLPNILSDLNLDISCKKDVYEILLKIKGEFLAEACFEEIKQAKKEFESDSFSQIKEKIIKKYTSIYIYESDQDSNYLKDYFYKALKNLESVFKGALTDTDYEKFPPQKPKKSSFWKRI